MPLTDKEKKLLVACYEQANGGEFDFVQAAGAIGIPVSDSVHDEAHDLVLLLEKSGLVDGLAFQDSNGVFTPEGRQLARELIETKENDRIKRTGVTQIRKDIVPNVNSPVAGDSIMDIAIKRTSKDLHELKKKVLGDDSDSQPKTHRPVTWNDMRNVHVVEGQDHLSITESNGVQSRSEPVLNVKLLPEEKPKRTFKAWLWWVGGVLIVLIGQQIILPAVAPKLSAALSGWIDRQWESLKWTMPASTPTTNPTTNESP